MAKEEHIEMQGKVVDTSRTQCLESNWKWSYRYRSHFGQDEKNYIRILTGDEVTVELTPYDLTK